MIVGESSFGDRVLRPGTVVWLLGNEAQGLVEIEHDGRRGRAPADAVVALPVPRPSIEELRKRDSCFAWNQSLVDLHM